MNEKKILEEIIRFREISKLDDRGTINEGFLGDLLKKALFGDKDITLDQILDILFKGVKDKQNGEIDFSQLNTKGIKHDYTGERGDNINYFIDQAKKAGITNPYAIIGMLSVIGKESGYIPKFEKGYGGTDNQIIKDKFGSRVSHLSDEELTNIKKDDKKFFNLVYANTVGNGKNGTSDDDGYNYRGAGLNQITGKGNYQKYSNLTGYDFVNNPSQLNDIKVATDAAIKFFTNSETLDKINYFKTKEEAIQFFANKNHGGSEVNASKAMEKGQSFDLD